MRALSFTYMLMFLVFTGIGATTTYLVLSNKAQEKSMSSTVSSKKSESFAFSVENPPSESLIGSVASLSGKINWLTRTATSEVALSLNTKVKQGEIVTTEKNSVATLRFSSCIITLSPETKLSLIQTLPANIVIEQSSGEAQYDSSCKLPLSVRIHQLLITTKDGIIRVIDDTDGNTVSVITSNDIATVAYNDEDKVSTLKTIPRMSKFTFDTDSSSGKITKIRM